MILSIECEIVQENSILLITASREDDKPLKLTFNNFITQQPSCQIEVFTKDSDIIQLSRFFYMLVDFVKKDS